METATATATQARPVRLDSLPPSARFSTMADEDGPARTGRILAHRSGSSSVTWDADARDDTYTVNDRRTATRKTITRHRAPRPQMVAGGMLVLPLPD